MHIDIKRAHRVMCVETGERGGILGLEFCCGIVTLCEDVSL